MVSITTDNVRDSAPPTGTTQDLSYLLKAVEVVQQFDYAGVSFEGAPSATALQMAEQAKALEAQEVLREIESLKSELLSNADAIGHGKVQEALAKLGGLAGGRGALNEARGIVAEAIAAANLDRADELAEMDETLAQKTARLWAEIKELEDDVAKKMRSALDRGDITQEQYDKWEAQYKHAQALPQDDPAKVAATQAAAQTAEDNFSRAHQNAHARGDDAAAEDYEKGRENTRDIQAHTKLLQAINEQRAVNSINDSDPQKGGNNINEEEIATVVISRNKLDGAILPALKEVQLVDDDTARTALPAMTKQNGSSLAPGSLG